MPARDRDRVRTLRGYAILDAEPEPRFDDITVLASTALDMPVAMVSLLDAKRQWILAAVGTARGELPREQSFCDHTIRSDELLIVEDALADPRFASHPQVVGPSAVRFYAGAPLIADSGHRLGTVSVLDRAPRQLGSDGARVLTTLARQVVDLLELRLTALRLDHALDRLQTMASLIPICSHCRKVRDEEHHWLTLERLVQAKTGSRFTHGICPDCVREHYPDAADDLLRRGR